MDRHATIGSVVDVSFDRPMGPHPPPDPQIQKKLKQEIKRVLGNRTDITPEDLAQLTYAKNCFQESLRIYSVVPHVTRVCMKDTVRMHALCVGRLVGLGWAGLG